MAASSASSDLYQAIPMDDQAEDSVFSGLRDLYEPAASFDDQGKLIYYNFILNFKRVDHSLFGRPP